MQESKWKSAACPSYPSTIEHVHRGVLPAFDPSLPNQKGIARLGIPSRPLPISFAAECFH